MEHIKTGWIIHIFALLHAATALTCRLSGAEDELLLTLLTMIMALLICLKRGFNVDFTAVCLIMVNIVGYLLGNAGAFLFSHLINSQYAIHALATTLTTEILGWSIVAFSKVIDKNRDESNPLSYRFFKWIIIAMVTVFSLRVGILFLISSDRFATGEMLHAASKVFSNSFALITLICVNIIYVRYSGRFGKKFGETSKIALLVAFIVTSALIGTCMCSIRLPFEITVSSWSGFILRYLVMIITQIGMYCIIFMINFTISAGDEMQKEKEMKHAAQYRYQKLKRQVNPHFLFNSLNALDCLVWEEKPELASTYIHKLAGVYRYMIRSEEEDLVRLSDELTFVDMYVDLLKVRFPEGYEVILDVREEDKTRFVLPCSIQLLIENASKHNAAGAESPLVIKVESDGEKVRVTNNIIPKVTEVQSSGLGQRYIRQQYMDLSGKAISIERTDEEYCVTLPLL